MMAKCAQSATFRALWAVRRGRCCKKPVIGKTRSLLSRPNKPLGSAIPTHRTLRELAKVRIEPHGPFEGCTGRRDSVVHISIGLFGTEPTIRAVAGSWASHSLDANEVAVLACKKDLELGRN